MMNIDEKWIMQGMPYKNFFCLKKYFRTKNMKLCLQIQIWIVKNFVIKPHDNEIKFLIFGEYYN